ncbi:MAG: helix-turn-helix domain-containing protein [Proteobacteria bacterium]|nr:helix-turn-helix domain-containing protein [Pseudomonadota bacterium]
MTQGFYELLGADAGATTGQIRAAYTRVVAGLDRRHKAIVEQGGDPSSVELSKAQATEAWGVLSDPARRRRYDAMRALTEDGWTTDPAQLWDRVSGALIHPAAASAVELLSSTTDLHLGQLPPAPGAQVPTAPARSREDERTVTATTVPRIQPAPPPISAMPSAPPPPITATPRFAPTGAPPTFGGAEPTTPLDGPDLRVVAGRPAAPDVLVMQAAPAAIGAEDIARLIGTHGHSGGLLRAVRELRGMTLQDMADTTRISVRYLEGVEAEARDVLPSATFVRGYVREMARMLDLDDHAVVAGYMQRFG